MQYGGHLLADNSMDSFGGLQRVHSAVIGLVVSLKNLSTVRLMVSLVKPLYKFGSKFQHSGISSGAVSCPASTGFGGADTRALTWDKHVQSLGSVTWDVWYSQKRLRRSGTHDSRFVVYGQVLVAFRKHSGI